jgi:hypothetical protein
MIGRTNAAAIVLAIAVCAVACAWNTRVAAGSDAFGYVSQADLWLKGDLFIDQSFAANAPWPMARWTFTPLGYRPEVDGFRIVPAYAPGLPMLMAVGKWIGGACAVYWIVPLAAGLLVLSTFAIGRLVAHPLVAIGAAWLIATSPTVLFMSMAPMSDVPAAAAWATATALTLFAAAAPMNARASAIGAAVGGLVAGVAILIRPNLVFLAAMLALWLMIRRRFVAGGWFVVLASAGAIAVAVINLQLYGSAFRSGYDLTDAFAVANIVPNLARYGRWLIETETPIALGGLIWLAWTRRWLLLTLVAATWAVYLVYVPWDAWWYLRFLLPSWPMMAVGTSMLLARLPRAIAVAAFVMLGIIGIAHAWQRDAFHEAAGESKYVEVARVVESLTRSNAVIISAQHSGTLRYYAGRMTLRWDVGDPAWLDRTVSWLAANGRDPYLLLEESEIEALRAKAGSSSVVARADWTPMVAFRGGAVKLFDAVRRESGQPVVQNKASFAVDGCAANKWFDRLTTASRSGG